MRLSKKAIEEVGMDTFKKTSLFGSNDPGGLVVSAPVVELVPNSYWKVN